MLIIGQNDTYFHDFSFFFISWSRQSHSDRDPQNQNDDYSDATGYKQLPPPLMALIDLCQIGEVGVGRRRRLWKKIFLL